jgi:transcriptional regulator with XRE-family HTH domain
MMARPVGSKDSPHAARLRALGIHSERVASMTTAPDPRPDRDERTQQFMRSFRDKPYRDAHVEAVVRRMTPTQIHEMRVARGWSQQDLADRLGVAQETVSRWEDANYGRFTLSTLLRIASVFDVALAVRFETFGRAAEFEANLSPEDLAVPPFAAGEEPRDG